MALARLVSRWSRSAILLLALVSVVASACSDSGNPASEELPENVSAPIGVKGGKLQASGVTLDIPEGALDKTVQISATNKGQTAPAQLGTKQLSDVYEFGPAGTKFNKDVTVTFPNKTLDERAEVYFTKEDGSGFEVIKSERREDQVLAKVKHFSQGFLGVPLEDADASGPNEPDADQPDAAASDDAGASTDAGVSMDASPSMDAEPGMDATSDDGSALDAGGPDSTVAKVHIVVNARDVYGSLVNQTWAAFQDGAGAWQPLPTPATRGVYEFDVASPVFGVALVCATQDNVNSWGTLHFAATASGTVLELGTPGSVCTSGTPVTKHTLTGTVRVPSGYWYWRFGHAHQYSPTFSTSGATTTPSFTATEMVHDELNDLAFATNPGTEPFGIARIGLRRDVRLSADQDGGFDFDLVDAGVAPIGNAQAQVLGGTGDAGAVDVHYLTRATEIGMRLNTSATSGNGARSASFAMLPEGIRRPTDLYFLRGSEDLTNQWRRASIATYPSGPLTVNLPPIFPVLFAAQPSPYLRPSFTFTQVTGAMKYTFNIVYSPTAGSNHRFDIELQPGWLQPPSQVLLTFPDFSQVAGFNPAWVAPNPGSVGVKAAVFTTGGDAGTALKSESGSSTTVQVP